MPVKLSRKGVGLARAEQFTTFIMDRFASKSEGRHAATCREPRHRSLHRR